MYTRQEASLIRKKFWTSFGQYMRPVLGAGGETMNWLNYKTGIRQVYFRMDAGKTEAGIWIELRQPEAGMRQLFLQKLEQLKTVLEGETNEVWQWQTAYTDEDGHTISRIGTAIQGVNIFNEKDWPAIISFLKPRIIALDAFWEMVKEGLDY